MSSTKKTTKKAKCVFVENEVVGVNALLVWCYLL